MAIIIDDTQVFFGGSSFELIKGNFIDDDSALVKAKPELFIIETKKVVKPTKPKTARVTKKVAPKEELLIEEPIAAMDVEETLTIKETEEKPKRKSRK